MLAYWLRYCWQETFHSSLRPKKWPCLMRVSVRHHSRDDLHTHTKPETIIPGMHPTSAALPALSMHRPHDLSMQLWQKFSFMLKTAMSPVSLSVAPDDHLRMPAARGFFTCVFTVPAIELRPADAADSSMPLGAVSGLVGVPGSVGAGVIICMGGAGAGAIIGAAGTIVGAAGAIIGAGAIGCC